MALTAQLVRDDRKADRETVEVNGTLRHVRNVPIDVTVEDLSATGFRIRSQVNLKLQEKVTIGIPGIGQRLAYVVRPTAEGFGCEFVEPIDPCLVTIPVTVDTVVVADFGGQLDTSAIREWSRANPPHVERFSPSERLFVIGGLGVAGWLTVFAVIWLL